jgi:tetrahydrodipicolinate N-succinyltransferase
MPGLADGVAVLTTGGGVLLGTMVAVTAGKVVVGTRVFTGTRVAITGTTVGKAVILVGRANGVAVLARLQADKIRVRTNRTEKTILLDTTTSFFTFDCRIILPGY